MFEIVFWAAFAIIASAHVFAAIILIALYISCLKRKK